jgi:hypothetical protein
MLVVMLPEKTVALLMVLAGFKLKNRYVVE